MRQMAPLSPVFAMLQPAVLKTDIACISAVVCPVAPVSLVTPPIPIDSPEIWEFQKLLLTMPKFIPTSPPTLLPIPVTTPVAKLLLTVP